MRGLARWRSAMRERLAPHRLDRPAGGIAEHGLPSTDAVEENREGGRVGPLDHGEGDLRGQGLRSVRSEQFEDESLLLQPSGGDDGGRQQCEIFGGGGEHRGDERPHGAVFEFVSCRGNGVVRNVDEPGLRGVIVAAEKILAHAHAHVRGGHRTVRILGEVGRRAAGGRRIETGALGGRHADAGPGSMVEPEVATGRGRERTHRPLGVVGDIRS